MPILNEEAYRIAFDRYYSEKEKQIAAEKGSDAAFRMMCMRVAKAIAKAEMQIVFSDADDVLFKKAVEDTEKWEQIFFEEIYSQRFVPGGRFWANIGASIPQLSNCFLLPIYDNKESIFTTLKNAAIIHSAGGGIGYDFSRLRSRGMKTTESKGISSGPVSFLKMYDVMADTISHGGSRRAACMGVLRIDHPDILEFIMVKDKTQKLRRFNISVAVTDIFMMSVVGKKWLDRLECYEPYLKQKCRILLPGLENCKNVSSRTSFIKEHYLERKISCTLVEEMSIEDLFPSSIITTDDIWRLLTEQAWECGDPGLLFIDEINRKNPLIKDMYDVDNKWYIRATNPCGEVPLEDNGICMLASVNLTKFVVAEKFDYNSFKNTIKIGIRFLDNSIDVSSYPLPEIKEAIEATRRIGLGIMGWADTLIKLGIKYGSEESIELASEIAKTLYDESLDESMWLGKERGNFPLFESSKYFIGDSVFPAVSWLRNAFRNTIAPTGTTSILAGTSSGIEPIFSFEYVRKDEIGERKIVHPLYEEWVNKSEKPPYFVTAMEVPWEEHINMQAAFQKNIDSSISKTINLSESSTIRTISDAFFYAYTEKCKGITVYRDKSKNVQVLNVLEKTEGKKSLIFIKERVERLYDQSEEKVLPKIMKFGIRERREGALKGVTYKVHTGEGALYVTVNSNEEGIPFEVFGTVGKAGSEVVAYTEAISRLISLALQFNISVEEIIKQLVGISGSKPIFHKIGKYNRILSIPDAIGKILDFHIISDIVEEVSSVSGISLDTSSLEICPKCYQEFRREGKCLVCRCGSACE